MQDARFEGSIDLPCPVCGETTAVTLAALRRNRIVPCKCGKGGFEGKELLRELDKLGGDGTLDINIKL